MSKSLTATALLADSALFLEIQPVLAPDAENSLDFVAALYVRKSFSVSVGCTHRQQ